jgi:ATP-binding cassette, subfamily B, bacterial MsbA
MSINFGSLKSSLKKQISLFGDRDTSAFIELFKEYFPKYWKTYAIMLGLVFVITWSTAMSAWLVSDVVNDIFVKKNGEYLLPLVVVIMVVFVAKGLSTYWETQLGARIANDMVADVQTRLFRHILRQRLGFFETYSSDDLTMRVNQGASSFSTVLNRVVVAGVRDAFTVIGLLIVMIAKDAALTAIVFLAVPVAFIAINQVLFRIKSLMQQEMRTIADLNKYVREIVQGAKVIKSYNVEPLIQKQADTAVESIRTISNRVSALNNAPIPIIDTLGGVGIGLTILYAGYRTVYTAYDAGAFMSFVTALLMATDPARRLSQMRVSLKTAMVGLDMVQQILKDDRSETSGTAKIAANGSGLAVSFKDVRFGYHPNAPVIKGFNLDVKAGEMVALVGPSGAGKSTVFSLLLRFYDYQEGSIAVGGRPIEDLSIESLRGAISYVGQTNFIFAGSLRDNLTLGYSHVTDEQITEACRAVGMHEHIVTLPRGYDTPVGELGALISGGQAQRLNIARAIIKDAPILLLDEVTSALDADNEELVRAYMHAQMGRKTILVIAHRLSTIRQADRIALVEGGEVRSFGSHKELIEGNDYYERMASLQLMA